MARWIQPKCCWFQSQPHPGTNLTNILQAAFLHGSFFGSSSLLTNWLCNFFIERISAQKMLVKLPYAVKTSIAHSMSFYISVFGSDCALKSKLLACKSVATRNRGWSSFGEKSWNILSLCLTSCSNIQHLIVLHNLNIKK